MITSNNASARQHLNFLIAGALRMMFLNLLVIPISTTVSFLKLMQPLQNTNYGEKTLSYLAPKYLEQSTGLFESN